MRVFNKLFILICSLTLVACQNIKPAQSPLIRLDNAHNFGATRVAFAPDGKRFASGGFEGKIKIWQLPTGKLLQTIRPHTEPVRGLVWLDDNRLISASEQGDIALFNWHTRQITKTVKTRKLTSLVLNRKFQTIYVGYKSGKVRAFSVPGLAPGASWRGSARINSLAINPATQAVAVATSDRKVALLSPALRLQKSLNTKDHRILELRFSRSGHQLAGSAWFKILVWQGDASDPAIRSTEHLGAIVSLDFDPAGRRIVSLGRHTDATIRLMDVKTGAIKRRLAAHEYCGWNIRYSPSGKYIVSASEDESVRIFDMSKPYKPVFYQKP